jgi:hypothetical protein
MSNFMPESPLAKLVEYAMSQQFTRIICLGLAVVSHGMTNLSANEVTPSSDRGIIQRASAFHAFVFNGSNNS